MINSCLLSLSKKAYCYGEQSDMSVFPPDSGMGKTCEPKAFSFQCMTKFTTKKKKKSAWKSSFLRKKKKSLCN